MTKSKRKQHLVKLNGKISPITFMRLAWAKSIVRLNRKLIVKVAFACLCCKQSTPTTEKTTFMRSTLQSFESAGEDESPREHPIWTAIANTSKFFLLLKAMWLPPSLLNQANFFIFFSSSLTRVARSFSNKFPLPLPLSSSNLTQKLNFDEKRSKKEFQNHKKIKKTFRQLIVC